ncbi:MAG TPA: hypothetical protein VFQ26_08700 [Nitrospiraceae bacterium]|nr:hypothetical protein [Nitrospiraceae bacterium]
MNRPLGARGHVATPTFPRIDKVTPDTWLDGSVTNLQPRAIYPVSGRIEIQCDCERIAATLRPLIRASLILDA